MSTAHFENRLGLDNGLSFFKTWTPEMSYILGFLFADGCITTRDGEYHEIAVEIKDHDHCTVIASTIDNNINVHRYTRHDGRSTSKFSIGVSSVIEDVVNLGLTPKKSKTALYPYVPRELQSHFVRGYFDGNGTVGLAKRNNRKSYRRGLMISVGSKAFSESLLLAIRSFTPAVGNIYKPSTTNAYNVSFTRLDEIRSFGEWIYDEASIFLHRKYEKWIEVITYNPESVNR